ncbi:MAG: metallophosphoesterase [Campylobacter sp.]|nr:metallophosphoesterase [Campylobacter sp.]
MARIFITGDTHGGWRGFSGELKKFEKFSHKTEKELCKDDFLIIAGDFGFIWESSPDKDEIRWLKYFDERNYTTLFIDGNHENFDRLNSYEVSEFKGGKVHKISESVYHLIRGQIYDFDGVKIFTLGGAMSMDKDDREQGVSWWKGENISKDDIEEANTNLAKFGYSVDIVITHTCPKSISQKLLKAWNLDKIEDKNMDILQNLADKMSFKKWYFGHWHETYKEIGDKFITIYNVIKEIEI